MQGLMIKFYLWVMRNKKKMNKFVHTIVILSLINIIWAVVSGTYSKYTEYFIVMFISTLVGFVVIQLLLRDDVEEEE